MQILCVIADTITYGFATVGKANVQKTLQILCVIADAITYGFATVGKANVQKALLFVTALYSKYL